MDLTQQLIMALYGELQSIVTKDIEMDSFIKAYHMYRKIWTPKTVEKLSTERKPSGQICNLCEK